MSRLLIQFSHLHKSFGPLLLFEGISFSINEKEIFALIGENGAGKTTLLQLLAGAISPDSGEFSKAPDLSIRFLPQEISIPDPLITVRQYLEQGVLVDLEKEMASCLQSNDRLTQWAELHEQYERLGGYRRAPIEKVLQGLKLEDNLLDLSMSTLSSGQRVRVALAKVLVENPKLLLLDEPTNHLDTEMMEWLEMTLRERDGACIIVTHDRKFLNAVCNRLVEIKYGSLTTYGGNFEFYLEEQKRLLERQIKAYEIQKEELSNIKQKIKAVTFSQKKPPPPSDRNIMAYDKHGESHQKSQQHKLNALKARLQEIEANPISHPRPRSIKGLSFNSNQPLTSAVAIELAGASKAFGDKTLFSDFNKTIQKGDRILVMGANGTGKTTLLRCLAGLCSLDRGKIKYAPSVKIAYLDQEVELLPIERTPVEYFETRFALTEENLRRELHKAALESTHLLRRPFSTLSTGQRKRLMLLSLLLEKPNVLLLDEPTNHLDILTQEALERALLEFHGAIVAISHDVTFIEKIATDTWEL